MSSRNQGFAVTICGYRKPGMDEDEYHKYISETHAGLLMELLIANKIVSYTMQHNTTKMREMTQQIYGPNFANLADCDAFVQIVFRDVQDYVNVRQDPHFKEVVAHDHINFADGAKTRMVMGWLEVHIADGKLVQGE